MKPIEPGDEIGLWKVDSLIEEYRIGRYQRRVKAWWCECKKHPGKLHPILDGNLKRGGSTCCVQCRAEKTEKRWHEQHPVKVGNRYGRWIVRAECENTDRDLRMWVCECDCGTVKSISAWHLVSPDPKSRSESCGCLNSERLVVRNASKRQQIIGKQIGKLLVLKQLKTTTVPRQLMLFLVECQCKEKRRFPVPYYRLVSKLRSVRVRSCGCLRKEQAAIAAKNRFTFKEAIDEFGEYMEDWRDVSKRLTSRF